MPSMTDDEIELDGFIWRESRLPISNKSVLLCDDKNDRHLMLIADESTSGMGCVYIGENPPALGTKMKWIEDNSSYSHVVIRWCSELDTRIFRIGIQFC